MRHRHANAPPFASLTTSTSGCSGGPTRRLSSAGKVVLAAIVHHDTICAPAREAANEEDEEKKRKLASNGKQTADKNIPINKQTATSKLGRLFSKKKHQTTENLIDRAQQQQQQRKSNEDSKQTSANSTTTSLQRRTKPPKSWVNAHQPVDEQSDQSYPSRKRKSSNNNSDREEPVIEFKFDLIVDESGEQAGQQQQPNEQQNGGSSLMRLNDNVNELVESFVLDSNDVCLMSIGKQRCLFKNNARSGNLNNSHHLNQSSSNGNGGRKPISTGVDDVDESTTFDYLCQLATHSLAYSFELLTSKRGYLDLDAALEDSAAGSLCSIELSATLFLNSSSDITVGTDDEFGTHTCTPTHHQPISSGSSSAPSFEIFDLMQRHVNDDENTEPNMNTNSDDTKTDKNSVVNDCKSLEQAMSCFETMNIKLRQLLNSTLPNFTNSLLMISFKLKQKINGGLFSNRMCLIDFDPKFVELYPIFESIFNGQALAHLKRHKIVHLDSHQSDQNNNENPSFEDESTLSPSLAGVVVVDKQHHQVASQQKQQQQLQEPKHKKLIQAEWLLYKQLSSALIRTLIIVHVHKLVLPQVGTKPIVEQDCSSSWRKSHEQQLMADNLELLEFARNIQRASTIRLRRRKRHLKSHLASSNVSVASNASATTTATHELLSSPVAGHLHTPGAPRGGRQSPLINHHTAERASRHHQRKTSMDMSLALARHRHNRNNNRYNHQQHHYVPPTHHRSQSQVNQRHYLDFTESSSMSTSSGSQKASTQTATVQQNQSYSRGTTYVVNNQVSLNNLNSDSDSITSANLNSCSSSSYRHNSKLHKHQQQPYHSSSLSRHYDNYQWQQQQQRHRSGNSKRRRDVELRWIEKNSRMMMMNHQNQHRQSSIELTVNCSTPLKESRATNEGTNTTARQMNVLEDTSNAPQVLRRDSSVIPIDCHPNSAISELSQRRLPQELSTINNNRQEPTGRQMSVSGDTTTTVSSELTVDNTDNVSDICSVIAEPPKQLKLEEFLNQLSSIIAPIATNNSNNNGKNIGLDRSSDLEESGNISCSSGAGSSEQASLTASCSNSCGKGKESSHGKTSREYNNADFNSLAGMQNNNDKTTHFDANLDNGRTDNGYNSPGIRLMPIKSNNCSNNNNAEEDDEDCKSHSSILEHLSSLALESNTKLNSRQQQQHQAQPCSYTKLTDGNHQQFDLDASSFILQTPPLSYSMIVDMPEQNEIELSEIQQSNEPPMTTGHLQQLLNSSAQLKKTRTNSRVSVVRDPTTVEDQLRMLALNCRSQSNPQVLD